MSCCGKSSSTARPGNSRPTLHLSSVSNSPPAYFRCTGAATVTAKGGISGKLYRFPHSGSIVSVDARDAISLSRVPHLQAVRPR